MIIGILTNAAYDLLKKLIEKKLPFGDKERKEFLEIFNKTIKNFYKKNKEILGTKESSFLSDSHNLHLLIDNLHCLDRVKINDFNIKGYGCDIREGKQALKVFLDMLTEEIAKNSNLRDLKILKNTNELKHGVVNIQKRVETLSRDSFNQNGLNDIWSNYSFDEYFKIFKDKTRLFNHSYNLVGRNRELGQLYSFIKSNKKIAILSGRGGIGKSKLLFELGKKLILEGFNIFVINEEVEITQEILNKLQNNKKIILFVDDAHRREDLAKVISIAKRGLKVVLSTRPQGVEYITSTLSRINLSNTDIEKIQELKDLSNDQMKELAQEVLSKEFQAYVPLLVRVAKDSPLVLVVGANLINQKAIAPDLIITAEDFTFEVMNKFEEEIVGQGRDWVSPKILRKLFALISILAPINLENKQLITMMAKYLDISLVEMLDIIGELIKNGISLKRGYLMRLTPDVLSDHILFKNASKYIDHETNLFIAEIYDIFHEVSLNNLIINVAELDWRVKLKGEETNYLNGIWTNIEQDLNSSEKISEVLDLMEPIAYYQPEKIFDIVVRLMGSNLDKSPDKAIILRKTPALLNAVCYHMEYLPQCIRILLNLIENYGNLYHDFGDKNPKEIVKDLAEYDLYKPLKMNEIILNELTVWMTNRSLNKENEFILDILSNLLSREIGKVYAEYYKFVYNSFVLDYDNTREIRLKCFRQLKSLLVSDNINLSEQMKIIEIFLQVIKPPVGLYGNQVTQEEIEQWIPENEFILKYIREIICKIKSPIIMVKIDSELSNYIQYNSVSEKQLSLVNKIQNLIVKEDEVKIIRVMWRQYNLWGKGLSFEERDEIINSLREEAINLLFKLYPCVDEVIGFLNSTIELFLEIGEDFSLYGFLDTFAKIDYHLTKKICNILIDDSSLPLTKHFQNLLNGLFDINSIDAFELIKMALAKKRKVLNFSLTYHDICRKIIWNDCEYALIFYGRLLKLDDFEVNARMLSNLNMFPEENREVVIKLLMDYVRNKGLRNSWVLKSFGELFSEISWLKVEMLSKEDLMIILESLIEVECIEGHDLGNFIAKCFKTIPFETLELFLKRIEFAQGKSLLSHHYRPISLGFSYAFKGIKETKVYDQLLKKVRDQLLEKKMSNYLIRNLFSHIARNYDERVLAVIKTWALSDQEEEVVLAGYLLREAHPGFIFNYPEFVCCFLRYARNIGVECYKIVSNSLAGSAISATRHGVAGQPMPQDIQLRDQAEKMMNECEKGSPVYKFYKGLYDYAKREIQEDLKNYEAELI